VSGISGGTGRAASHRNGQPIVPAGSRPWGGTANQFTIANEHRTSIFDGTRSVPVVHEQPAPPFDVGRSAERRCSPRRSAECRSSSRGDGAVSPVRGLVDRGSLDRGPAAARRPVDEAAGAGVVPGRWGRLFAWVTAGSCSTDQRGGSSTAADVGAGRRRRAGVSAGCGAVLRESAPSGCGGRVVRPVRLAEVLGPASVEGCVVGGGNARGGEGTSGGEITGGGGGAGPRSSWRAARPGARAPTARRRRWFRGRAGAEHAWLLHRGRTRRSVGGAHPGSSQPRAGL
jgi:hypothetical protein